jgi:hypothetical protein
MLVESGGRLCPELDARVTRLAVPLSPEKPMTERDWELYRLSVVQQLPVGPYKDATIDGINFKLRLLDQQELRPASGAGRRAAAARAAMR